MVTTADNITFKSLRVSETEGAIRTILSMRVWDCVKAKWSNADRVVLRNTMLAALHPSRDFTTGEIPVEGNPTFLANKLGGFRTPASKGVNKAFKLDMASNARTHGRFTFAADPVGKVYYGSGKDEQWKRIIYGSIIHTGCRRMYYKKLRYVIVDDENRDSKGNQFDDPTNNRNWQSGDSHGKASADLMDFLRSHWDFFVNTELDPDDESPPEEDIFEPNPIRPLQFRAALRNEWVAKGTIAHNPDLEGTGIDLILPLSCFKGNKPALGNYEEKLLIGVVHEAERRRAKPGWMLWQWFAWEVLEQDGIIAKLDRKCQNLSGALDNIQNLVEILRIDQNEAEAEITTEGELQSEAEYENTMIRMVRSDLHGLLLLHPYIVRRIQERLQRLWLNLAKSAGVRFYSVLTQPDDLTFAPIYEAGDLKFCAAGFEPEEYIIFVNPMRHWGDVQVWTNRHIGAFREIPGVMASGTEQFLSLGRDFDGDFVQLYKADAYPNIVQAIANFEDTPTVKKLPKVPLEGSIQTIAVGSMTNMTGMVASLLGRAGTIGAEFHTLRIPNTPPYGNGSGIVELRIIDILSQELQIAVDSLKSAYPNNVQALDIVKKYLSGDPTSTAPWLADFKHPDCYRTRPCVVNDDAEDTISRLVKLVNSYWREPSLPQEGSPRAFRDVLFNNVSYEPSQLDRAMADRDRYRNDMREAIAWKEANDGNDTQIRAVAERWRAYSEQTLAIVDPATGQPYSEYSWCAAYWQAAHEASSGTGSMVFLMFPSLIESKLRNYDPDRIPSILVYGVQYGSWSLELPRKWTGQRVKTRPYFRTTPGTSTQKLAIEMLWPDAQNQIGWYHLGLVGETDVPRVSQQIGQVEDRRIFGVRWSGNTLSSVKILLADLPEEEIRNYI